MVVSKSLNLFKLIEILYAATNFQLKRKGGKENFALSVAALFALAGLILEGTKPELFGSQGHNQASVQLAI